MIPDPLSLLACPLCNGSLLAGQTVITPSGRLKSGVFLCVRCGRLVGVIRNFKYDFVYFESDRLGAPAIDQVRMLDREVCDEVIPFDDDRVCRQGGWEVYGECYQLSHGTPGDELVWTGECHDLGVRLLKHPWSGTVRFELDGSAIATVDLFQPQWSTVYWFPIANDLAPGTHTLKIIPTGEKNPESSACQVLFHELVVTRSCDDHDRPGPVENTNRVLPVFPAVLELMKQVPEDGLILDCGCGDRILEDPRYIGLDYERYQLPSVYGDALRLPFHDNTFDFTFSQAVLEHVPDPARAVSEMRRVTKHGGTVWAGMAFMQPVHAVPSHYFNATAWGIRELFRDLEIRDVNWFGQLSFTIDWLFKASGIAGKADPAEYAELMERIKSYDKLVSYEELKNVASGVAVEAVKK